jgi:CDP-diglyceride synthetase
MSSQFLQSLDEYLRELTPNKTVEGFLGAWLFTVLTGFRIAHFMAQYIYIICEANDFCATFSSFLASLAS